MQLSVILNGEDVEIWSIFLHSRHALIPNFGGIFGTKYVTLSPQENQTTTLSLSIGKVNVTYISEHEGNTCSESPRDFHIERCLEKTLVHQVGCRYEWNSHLCIMQL